MCACFVVDQSVPSVEELPLKNTFVHFDEPLRARRATCVGRFLTQKRRRSVARVNTRARTAPSTMPARKPRGEVWHALVCASEPPAYAPAPVGFGALRPPPVVTQRTAGAFACPMQLSQCSTPPLSPYSQCPTQQWSPCPTPPSTPPLSPSTPECVWQRLNEEPKQESKKRNRNRKQNKAPVIPAKQNEMTVMLRLLPTDYTPDAIQAKFPQFLPFIDFYYLPTNFDTKKNLGYAFVNFTCRDVAQDFVEYWEKIGIAETGEKAVVDARVQGYAENVERFRNSSVMPVLAEELKPRIFCKGVQMPFPQGDGVAPPVGPRFRPTGQ